MNHTKKHEFLSFDLAFTEGQCFEYAFALLNCEVAAAFAVELPLEHGQSAHDHVLHLIGPSFLGLALLPCLFELHPRLAVLLPVLVVVFLQFVHLFKEELVLAFQVLVLVLEDALDGLVIRCLLLGGEQVEVFVELRLEDRLVGDSRGGLRGVKRSHAVLFLLWREHLHARSRGVLAEHGEDRGLSRAEGGVVVSRAKRAD